jgi:hypothetical protein
MMATLLVVLAAIAAGIGGYAVGKGSGPDVPAARAAGASAGKAAGAEKGMRAGYAVGYKAGRTAGYKQSYRDAFERAASKK